MVLDDVTYDPVVGQECVGADPDFLRLALALAEDDDLLAVLRSYRHTGRPGYSVSAMWRAFLAKYLLGLRYTRDLIAQLHTSPALRDVCGFGDDVPHESNFSRFFARLLDHQQEIDRIQANLTDRVGAVIEEQKRDGNIPSSAPVMGNQVAIDSTDIPSRVDVDRVPITDPGARWGVRTSKTGSEKTEYFFGYKMHAVVDAFYGTPLGHIILPANEGDSPQLPVLLDRLADRHPNLRVRYVMADRGYDATSNYTYLDDQRILSVIKMRDTDKDGIYTLDGRPKCLGDKPMDYVRTDRGKGHLFRCPPGGCHLKDRIAFSRYCDSEHHERLAGDPELLRKVGRLPRVGRRWASLYRRRQTVERWFNSVKASRLLTGHRYRQRRKVTLHASLSVLTYSATMLARLQVGDYADMRQMRLPLPTVLADTRPLALAA